MSLHNLANHLQSAGRGQDSVLVHMTPGEVKGLQSLAMSQGGSLTINPQTGLPEAGILSSLLPIVAGAFLGPAGLGLTAMQTGLAVGALGTAATGSLGKGLMMGFGAYGGAGLGEGLMNAGASAMPGVEVPPIGADAASAADMAKIYGESGPASWGGGATGTEIQNAGINATTPVSQAGAFNAYTAPKPFEGVNFSNYQNPVTGQYVNPVGASAPDATSLVQNTGKTIQDINATGGVRTQLYTAPEVNPAYDVSPTRMPTELKVPNKMDQLGAGFKDVTSSGDKAWSFVKEHPAPFIGVGVGALQSYQEQQAEDAANAANAAKGGPGMIRPYEMSVAQNQSAYAPNPSTAEREYFVNPRFIPKEPFAVAKEGGLMGIHKYAVGGPVEEMSAANAVGANMMYPQSQLQTPVYSNPMMSRPMPTSVINAGGDAPVNPYTGEAKFADGGPTTSYKFDPATQKFTQTTTNTPAERDTSFGGLAKTGLGIGARAIGNIAGGFGSGIGSFNGVHNYSALAGGLGGASTNPTIAAFYKNQQTTPQPTTTTQTSGGISAPAMQAQQPQTQPANPIIPNINIPPQQDVNKQLGLQAFYPFMEQQLAAKGAQMQSQNMADGGSTAFNRDKQFVMGRGWIPDPSKTTTPTQIAAAAPARTYTYNAPTQQFTDNIGQVTGGVATPFMPSQLAGQDQQMGMAGYQGYAEGGTANGGYSLGGYSDGGRLLRGPGDGVSDSIPASIGDRQPARLADGEFVVNARTVSEIGNGSTEAGARKLYAMMDRVAQRRKKSIGKGKIAVDSGAHKELNRL